MEPFFKKWIKQANKRLYNHRGCPKNRNSPIFVQNNEIYSHDQNIGSPEKFYFVMQSICGSFFQKQIEQANKMLFQPYRMSKKYE